MRHSSVAAAIIISILSLALSASAFAQDEDDGNFAGDFVPTRTKAKKKARRRSRAPAQALQTTLRPPPHKERLVHYIVGFGYHNATTTTFKSVTGTVSGAPATGQVVNVAQPAYELSAGVLVGRRHSFGMFGTVTYQTNREISSTTTTLNGNDLPVDYSSGKPTMQVTIFELGGLYRFDNLYIPAGINFPIAGSGSGTPDDGSGLSPKTNAGPALGYQAGIGYFIWGGLHVEALYKVLAVQVKTTIPGTAMLDLKTGYTPGAEFQVRWAF